MNTNEPLPAVAHPGVYLRELMTQHRLTACRVAKDIGASVITISQIIKGTRRVSPTMALRLGRYFIQHETAPTPAEWCGFQMQYDLNQARRKYGVKVEKTVKPLSKD